MREGYTLDNIDSFVGQELGVSSWRTIDQAQIDAFADATDDHQWIHIDPERAARESPLGTTIAHGYLTLSLLVSMNGELAIMPDGVLYVLNYGSDKVRFLHPVPVGARIRNRAVLAEVTSKGPGRTLLRITNTVEIEGIDKPAMVADTLSLLIGG